MSDMTEAERQQMRDDMARDSMESADAIFLDLWQGVNGDEPPPAMNDEELGDLLVDLAKAHQLLEIFCVIYNQHPDDTVSRRTPDEHPDATNTSGVRSKPGIDGVGDAETI